MTEETPSGSSTAGTALKKKETDMVLKPKAFARYLAETQAASALIHDRHVSLVEQRAATTTALSRLMTAEASAHGAALSRAMG